MFANKAYVTQPLLRYQSPLVWAAAIALAGAGAWLMARAELQRLHAAFETDARIVHRLLSQRMVQHEAVLSTLALVEPAGADQSIESRLPAAFPQLLQVSRRLEGQSWPSPGLTQAEATSRAQGRPTLGALDMENGRYLLVTSAGRGAYALSVDLGKTVPWDEWPMDVQRSPVRVELVQGTSRYQLQTGRDVPSAPGWLFGFEKTLASDSQPFLVRAAMPVGWTSLPLLRMLAWAALVLGVAWAWQRWRRQLVEQRRAEELLRLGQISRLNTMGELAAGVAHELNQPLTAVLANTQASLRLLNESPPDLDLARTAMTQSVQQAQRASEVVGRMRRQVERPDAQGQSEPLLLDQALRNALHLLEPELRRRQVQVDMDRRPAPTVMADPVALEQVIHNLLMNALQALEAVPSAGRRLILRTAQDNRFGRLTVTDTGPGVPGHLLPHIFEPFLSTREGGLGLGLSLCETLASTMGGSLEVRNAPPLGAEFTLSLPLRTP